MENKSFLIVLGGVLLILILLTAFFFFFKPPNNTQTSNQTLDVENVDSRDETSIPAGDVGQLATMALQVHGFEKAESISGSLFGTTQSKENTHFILVDVSVTNTTNQTFTLYPSGILLANREGVSYDTYLSTSGGVIGAEESAVDGRDLGSGIEERGVLVYEVPNTFIPYSLEIEKLDTNKTLVFELEKSETDVEPAEVSYRIIEEEDISYRGCKRLGLRITVPDDARERDVDFTLASIAEEYLEDWTSITIWAWGYSEEAEVGASMTSKGTYEESLSSTCN